jgi:nucleoside-diphosphate-sugar epimerase
MDTKNVLITGATGFVGSRLAERLVLGTDHNVTAVVHRFSGPGLARLARLPVKLFQADLLDPESLEKAAKNCHIIIHLAYGSSGDNKTKREITVSGTENILKAALKMNVKKVIHFSTAAVHGLNSEEPVINESAPFTKSHDVYIESKIEAEKIVWQYHKGHGLPVVVFRPPIIYGPYGAYWTARIVDEIRKGAILANGGIGAANLIYVDNLIDAVLLAMGNDTGDGEAFIVVDDDELTWKDVYEAYAGMMDSYPPIRHMSKEEIETMRKGDEPNDFKSWVVKPFFLVPALVRNSLRSPEMRSEMMQVPWMRFIKNRMSRMRLNEIKYGGNNQQTVTTETTKHRQIRLPSQDLVELYSSHSRFSNEKIKRFLNFTQRITFPEALDLIYSWLKYQRII